MSLLDRGAARAAARAGRPSAAARVVAGQVELAGRNYLVTGSTDGIGLHTARRLAAAGADVFVHGRSRERLDAAAASVRRAADGAAAARGSAGAGGGGTRNTPQRVEALLADLSDLREVRRLAATARELAGPGGIDCLVNNAGVYETSLQCSADGFEMTYAVNVLAPFLLTALLLDKVTCQVITTSSISAAAHLDTANLQQERGYSAHGAYSASKLCNQIFTLGLARRLAASGSAVLANALDPGTVNTKMLLAGWGRIGIEVGDADNTFELAANPGGETGAYFVGGRRSRPVAAAADSALQDRMWATWERQTGQEFRV